MRNVSEAFKYIPLISDLRNWTSLHIEDVYSLNIEYLKIFESKISNIKDVYKVNLISYTNNNDIVTELNIICYHIQYHYKKQISFIYIPVDMYQNYIREEKLKRILE